MPANDPGRLPFCCIFVMSCLFLFGSYSKAADVSGMFVFGSSLVDNGNNNFLKNSMAKADYLPYGIDFPNGPTGRFTNGKNVIDLLCDQLKLPFIPAFADPSTKGDKIIHGVNHASGASGILDDTGSLAGEVVSLSQQIKNFEEVTLPDLESVMGYNTSRKLLANYLFVVASGGNDYSFNYLLSPTKANVSLEDFTTYITNTLSIHLQKLYHLGGRKYVLMSINPIGCSPMLKLNGLVRTDDCIQSLNRAAQLFNAHLISLVDRMKQMLPGSNAVFVNSYKIIRDIIRDPPSKGFIDKSNPCCKVLSIIEGGNGVLCKENGNVCQNRSLHVFFDGLHPTEAVNIQIASKAYNSPHTTEVYPFNVEQLAIM